MPISYQGRRAPLIFFVFSKVSGPPALASGLTVRAIATVPGAPRKKVAFYRLIQGVIRKLVLQSKDIVKSDDPNGRFFGRRHHHE